MARHTSVLAAALAGGVIGGTFVGVACWVVARGIMPPTIIVRVETPTPPRQAVPYSPLDEWTPLDDAGSKHIGTSGTPVSPQPARDSRPAVTARAASLTASDQSRAASRAQAITNVQAMSSTNVIALQPQQMSLHAQTAAPLAHDHVEALSYALQALEPVRKEGFTIRQDYWTGVVANGEPVTLAHQLFKGNEYWFAVGTSVAAGISIHVYDDEGNIVDSDSRSNLRMGAAFVRVSKTGTYHTVIEQSSPVAGSKAAPAIEWALIYGFR